MQPHASTCPTKFCYSNSLVAASNGRIALVNYSMQFQQLRLDNI